MANPSCAPMCSALLGAILLMAPLSCGESDKPSMSEALKQADAKEAARKEAEAKARKEAAEKAKEEESDALEIPWSIDELKEAMKMDTVATYQVSGVDEKGKDVQDTYTVTVKGTGDDGTKINAFHQSDADEPIATQVATHPWSNLSPMFAVDKPETEVVAREKVEVPAGTFDAVVVEIRGFFGAHRTVYMIPDQPGIYAKVIDHGNDKEEDDQTEKVYELQKIERPQ